MLSRRSLLASTLGLGALSLAPHSFAQAQTPISGTSIDPVLWSYLSSSPTAVANLDQGIPLLVGNQRLQADALDIALPFDMDDPDQLHAWIQGMYNVSLPSFIQTNALRDEFTDLTGFAISQIDSGAEIGEPPDSVAFLRGSFDQKIIQATQLLLGYKPREVEGRPVFSLFEDAEVDLHNPINQMALARMNNSTFLDDGTVVYAATLDLIKAVLTPESTLASLPPVAQAANTLDQALISSALLGLGAFTPATPLSILQPTSQDDIAAAILAMRQQSESPVVLSAIVGSTPGGPLQFPEETDLFDPASQPRSVGKFALVYLTADEAVRAAPLIEQQLASGSSVVTERPWSELFASWSTVPNPDEASVLLTIEWRDQPARPLQLIFNRDLGFITG